MSLLVSVTQCDNGLFTFTWTNEILHNRRAPNHFQTLRFAQKVLMVKDIPA